jgi:hypothetical protein
MLFLTLQEVAWNDQKENAACYIGSHMHVAAFKALPIWNLFFKQAVLIVDIPYMQTGKL